MEKITAGNILKMLEQKHEEDIFVPECKNGSTWFNNHSRLDAWAMKKSWKNTCYTGYEIKISKSDFNRDCKYTEYLPMCNEFYFVCPWNMIQVSEIPLEVGLIYTSKNCTSLITRKKATHRKIEDPIDTLLYVLMFRVKIKKMEDCLDSRKVLEKWIENKKKDLNFGLLVSKKIRQVIEEKIKSVENDNEELQLECERMEHEVENCKESIELLKLAGITEGMLRDKYFSKYKVERLLEKYGVIPKDFLILMKQVRHDIDRIIEGVNGDDVS